MTSSADDISFDSVLTRTYQVPEVTKSILLLNRSRDKSLRTTRLFDELHSLLIDGRDSKEIERIYTLIANPPGFEEVTGSYEVLNSSALSDLSRVYNKLHQRYVDDDVTESDGIPNDTTSRVTESSAKALNNAVAEWRTGCYDTLEIMTCNRQPIDTLIREMHLAMHEISSNTSLFYCMYYMLMSGLWMVLRGCNLISVLGDILMSCVIIAPAFPIPEGHPVRGQVREIGITLGSILVIGWALGIFMTTILTIITTIMMAVIHDTVRDSRLLKTVDIAYLPHIYYALSDHVRLFDDSYVVVFVCFYIILSMLGERMKTERGRYEKINGGLVFLWYVTVFFDITRSIVTIAMIIHMTIISLLTLSEL